MFEQLVSLLPDRELRRCSAHFQGDAGARKLSCWRQHLAMADAQRTYRESLRDIDASR
jgi:hypothetical protein